MIVNGTLMLQYFDFGIQDTQTLLILIRGFRVKATTNYVFGLHFDASLTTKTKGLFENILNRQTQ